MKMKMTDNKEIEWMEVIEYVRDWLWKNYFYRYNVSEAVDVYLASGKKARSVRNWKNTKGSATTYGQPYRIALKHPRSIIYLDREIFKKYDNDLGDIGHGVICHIIRAFCEYVCRACTEEWIAPCDKTTLTPKNKLHMRRASTHLIGTKRAKAKYSTFFFPPENDFPKIEKENKSKHDDKNKHLRIGSWFGLWLSMVRNICGKCLPVVDEMPTLLEPSYHYQISREKLRTKRATSPKGQRAYTGKEDYDKFMGMEESVTVKLKTGSVTYPTK